MKYVHGIMLYNELFIIVITVCYYYHCAMILFPNLFGKGLYTKKKKKI